jgi:hypothetical protein
MCSEGLLLVIFWSDNGFQNFMTDNDIIGRAEIWFNGLSVHFASSRTLTGYFTTALLILLLQTYSIYIIDT